MNDYLYIPLVGLIGLLSTILSSKGGLFDLRRKWYKIVTKRGWVVTTMGIALIVLSIVQIIHTDNENKQKEILDKKRQSEASTKINAGIEANRKVLFSDLSEALAKQNIKFDSLKKKFESININTSASSKDLQSYLTGGDSYPEFEISPINGSEARIILQMHGKYTLYDLEFDLIDIDMKTGDMKTYRYKVGNFMPSAGMLLPGTFRTDWNKDSKLFYVYSLARNGRVNQFIQMAKIDGKWKKTRNDIINLQTSKQVKAFLN